MRRIVFCFLIIVCCTNLCAQDANRNSLVGRINDIKKQSDTYFWDQYTHPDADTAKIGSVKRIIIHIESSLNEQEKFSIEEVLPYTEFISINRGNLKQYFAYIKKSVAFAIKSGGMPSSVSETPASVEAKTNESIIMPSTPSKSFVPDAFVQRIYEVKTFSNVYKLLKSMQGNGQILQFGKLKDVEDYSSFDLILFDMKSQDIVTLLSAENGNGTRTNMLDGSSDSLDNYPKDMTAVIWYIKN